MSEPDNKKQRTLRPRDAATLILYRQAGRQVEVLMGERHGGHAFMPNRYVFPGGRVDPTDHKVRSATALKPLVAANLAKACGVARARALANAAIRETFEETGLLIGAPDPNPGMPVPKAWEPFFASGLAPTHDVLDYVVRAITPPFRPSRFNARFFIADARYIQGSIKGSGELLDLRWIAVEDALKLELPGITEIVLQQINALIARPQSGPHGVTLYRMRYGKRLVVQE